jgi:hypothetical protein
VHLGQGLGLYAIRVQEIFMISLGCRLNHRIQMKFYAGSNEDSSLSVLLDVKILVIEASLL